jgi:beta-1,4-galactosyltransferase 1
MSVNMLSVHQTLFLCPHVKIILSIIFIVMYYLLLMLLFQKVYSGGRYLPSTCRSANRVAIIIPYRNREEQLRLFLNHLHPILGRQNLVYGIYVVNQDGFTKFNRALLFNVGYAEAVKDIEFWDCFVFHDVDLMPEDDRNVYSCPVKWPRHMSVGKWMDG